MYRLDDQQLVLSATDLTSYLACEHLIEQRRAVALRERARWARLEDPHGRLAKDRGIAHEQEVLGRLSDELGAHVDLTAPEMRFTRAFHVEQAARTAAAMSAGAPLIYQALLFDGRWQGRVDFLRRVPVASALGPWSYEVLDTKLARAVKPYVVHQLALYTRLLGRGPGAPRQQAAHLILGDGREQRVDLRRYGRSAPPRRPGGSNELVEARRAAHLPRADRALRPVRPRPRLPRRAGAQTTTWMLVANARRDQRARLVEAGLPRVHDLAGAPAGLSVPKLGAAPSLRETWIGCCPQPGSHGSWPRSSHTR